MNLVPAKHSAPLRTASSHIAHPMSTAQAVWWNAARVFVKCPHCDHVHSHHFKGYNSPIEECKCSPALIRFRKNYNIEFPFIFEINKTERCYEACNLDPSDRVRTPQMPEHLEDDLVHGPYTIVADGVAHTDGVASVLATAVAHCVKGDLDALKQVLATKDLMMKFNTARYRPDSSPALLFAAKCMQSDIIAYLLDGGADVNATNRLGQTALMQAALWSRSDNVQQLLKHGALVDLEDGQQQKAEDYAKLGRFSSEQRYYQHHEDPVKQPFADERQRTEIVDVLRRLRKNEDSTAMKNESPLAKTKTFLVRVKGFNQVVPATAFTDGLAISHAAKTVASLSRGPGYPNVLSVSGYTTKSSTLVIDSEEWSKEVRILAKRVDYKFPDTDDRDPDWYASHAEKQLVAYFVAKHRLLKEHDFDAEIIYRNKAHQQNNWPTAERVVAYRPGYDDSNLRQHHTKQLLSVPPPAPSLHTATIFVSRAPCSDCEAFLRWVNKRLHLSIEMERQLFDLD